MNMENLNGKLDITLGEDLAENEKLDIKFELYIRIYEEALKAVFETIEYNDFWNTGDKEKGKVSSGENKSYIAPLAQSNIIAFMGERGTGKTTAISEFCKLLQNFHRNTDAWKRKLSNREFIERVEQFYILPSIDASILSEREDLIEVILASMYQAFQESKSKENREQEIFEERIIHDFDQAYKDYINVGRRKEQSNLGETPLVKLNNVSNSLKTRVAFDELIKHFLEYMCNTKSNKTYLVITIDDLDMNPEKGFEMLEQLHKYLENVRVIVLIAIRGEQINFISQKHFVDCLIPEYGSTHQTVYDKYAKEAKKLSADYLSKILPVPNRVYLPEKSQLYPEAQVGYKGVQKKEDYMPIKEFIIGKIASKMNIFYDVKGMKKHFCLPNTIRELVAYVAFLDSLLSIKEIEDQSTSDEEKTIMHLYDRNHERFNKDIENRMAVQLLDDDQLERFKMILERNIERRAEYAVDFLESRMSGKKTLGDGVDDKNYCYTDLLRVLYELGRINYNDKVLVHCILASFTSEMVREYYSYCYNTKPDARQRALNRLKSFRGKTFGGEWVDKEFPEIICGGQEKTWSRKLEEELRLFDIKIECTEKKGMTEEWLIKNLTDIVPYIECVTLLLYGFKDMEGNSAIFKWNFEIRQDLEPDEKNEKLIIFNEAYQTKIDFLGFIGRELLEENSLYYGGKLHQELVEGLKTAAKSYMAGKGKIFNSRKKASVLRKIEKAARNKSIWDDLEFGKGDVKRRAIYPYYNLDMSYNIMKRVRREVQKMERRVPETDICINFRKVYGYIAECLKGEEEYYEKVFGKSFDVETVPAFYSNFVNSPFIKAFGIIMPGEEDNTENGKYLDEKQLNKILAGIISGSSPDIISQMNEHEMTD